MTTQTLELIFLIIGIIFLLLALGLFMTSEWYEQEHGLNVQHSDLSNSINGLKTPLTDIMDLIMSGMSPQNNDFTSYENVASGTTTSGGGSASSGASSGATTSGGGSATGGGSGSLAGFMGEIGKIFSHSSNASDDSSSSDKDSYNKTNKRILLTSMIFVWLGFVSIFIGISLHASRKMRI